MAPIDLRTLFTLTPHHLAAHPELDMARRLVEVVNGSYLTDAASQSPQNQALLVLDEAEQRRYQQLMGRLSQHLPRLIAHANTHDISRAQIESYCKQNQISDPALYRALLSAAALDAQSDTLSFAECGALLSALEYYTNPHSLSAEALRANPNYLTNTNRPFLAYQSGNLNEIQINTFDAHEAIHLAFLRNLPEERVPALLRELFFSLSQNGEDLHFSIVEAAYQRLSPAERATLPSAEMLFASLHSLVYQIEAGARFESVSEVDRLNAHQRLISTQVLQDLEQINDGFTARAATLAAGEPAFERSVAERRVVLERVRILLSMSSNQAALMEAGYQPDGTLQSVLAYLGRHRLSQPTHPDSRAYDILVYLLRTPTLIAIRNENSVVGQTRQFLQLASFLRQEQSRIGPSGNLIYPAEISNLNFARQIYSAIENREGEDPTLASLKRVASLTLEDSMGQYTTNFRGEHISGDGSANFLTPWRMFSYNAEAGFHVRNLSDEEVQAAGGNLARSAAVIGALVGALYLLKTKALPLISRLAPLQPIAQTSTTVMTRAAAYVVSSFPRMTLAYNWAASSWLGQGVSLTSKALGLLSVDTPLVLGAGNLITRISGTATEGPTQLTRLPRLYIGPVHSVLGDVFRLKSSSPSSL